MRRIILTGSGASGLGYIAELLRTIGIKCGHGEVFTAAEEFDWGESVVDASWLAVPWLRLCNDELVIHVVRDPLRVAQSMVPFFDPQTRIDEANAHWTAQRNAVRRIFPEVFRTADPFARFCSFYKLWNAEIERRANMRVRIEEVTDHFLVTICEFFGHLYEGHMLVRARAETPTNYNSNPLRDPTIEWSQIEQLEDVAQRYGYRRW